MKKIDLLLSGGALGGVEGVHGKCDIHCFDISPIMSHPSSLIWADTIILTESFQKEIEESATRSTTQKAFSKAVYTIFEIAKEYDIVKVKNQNSVLTPGLLKEIDKEVQLDMEILPKIFPQSIQSTKEEKDNAWIIVENTEYCPENLKQVYSSLILAKQWNSELIFSDRVYNYCKYKFGVSLFTRKNEKVKAFDNIFNVTLPDNPIIPAFAYGSSKSPGAKPFCDGCTKVPLCEENYLKILENNVHDILDLRDKDEIQQIKGVIQDITGQLEQADTQYDYREIVRQFRKKERVYNKDLRSAFPKVQRFTNVAIYASIPAMLLGQATGLPILSYAAAAAAGITAGARELIAYSNSKYNWIAFLQQSRKEKRLKECVDK
jgi:hypothetical protein